MSPYGLLLSRAAWEMRQCRASPGDGRFFDADWIETISRRLDAASHIEDIEAQEREILSIGRTLSDSGPSDERASPAFWQALGAVQRRRRGR